MVENLCHLKDIIVQLCKETSVASSAWIDYLDRGFKGCGVLDSSSHTKEDDSLLSELENLAIDLWNFSVALKTKGSVPAESNAKMRHLAFTVLEFTCKAADKDASLKRQIMMGQKAGRACLDCSFPEFAEADLCKTERCIQRLQKLVLNRGTGDGDYTATDAWDKQKLLTEQDLFAVKCCRAEACVAIGRENESLSHLEMAKKLLPKFPKQGSLLSMMCYNMGVELYQKQMYQPATVWLRESYELGKDRQNIGPKSQARTLRLLASAYLETNRTEDNLQSALNAVSLANKEHCHPAGLFLMLKIHLLKNSSEETLKRAAENLMKIPELTIDLSLHTLQLINEHKRILFLTWMIEELLKRFENSPDIGKLLVTNLEVLVEANMTQQSKQFVEYCITAHNKGQALDFTIKKRFYVILWEQASKAFQSGDAGDALEWYNYYQSLYTQTDTDDVNLARLYRNRAICHTALQQTEKAHEAIEMSVKYDPLCAYSQFMLFKVALMERNRELACSSLKKMCELTGPGNSGDNNAVTSELIALAAQQALEHNFTEAATYVLEHICSRSPDSKQVLTALNNLIRLKLASADNDPSDKLEAEDIIRYVRMANNKLLHVQEIGDHGIDWKTDASWFMNISWNIALQCTDQPVYMKDLFALCSQLLRLLPQDESCVSRQVTCLLMAAAACLELARTCTDSITKKLALEECLDHLANILKQSTGMSESKTKERDVLMLLFEFEARLRLQDPRVESVLERALTVSGLEPKVFETLAAIAMESPSSAKNLSVRALKVAVRKHLQKQQPDMLKCSKLYHSLIKMCLSGGCSEDLNGKDEAWNYYTDIFDFIDNRAQGQYPEIEIVWLMTKAWNCGINFYSCSKYEEAEKWCAMSMKMLKYLDTFQYNYQDHMSGIYSDILAKVECNSQIKPLKT